MANESAVVLPDVASETSSAKPVSSEAMSAIRSEVSNLALIEVDDAIKNLAPQARTKWDKAGQTLGSSYTLAQAALESVVPQDSDLLENGNGSKVAHKAMAEMQKAGIDLSNKDLVAVMRTYVRNKYNSDAPKQTSSPRETLQHLAQKQEYATPASPTDGSKPFKMRTVEELSQDIRVNKMGTRPAEEPTQPTNTPENWSDLDHLEQVIDKPAETGRSELDHLELINGTAVEQVASAPAEPIPSPTPDIQFDEINTATPDADIARAVEHFDQLDPAVLGGYLATDELPIGATEPEREVLEELRYVDHMRRLAGADILEEAETVAPGQPATIVDQKTWVGGLPRVTKQGGQAIEAPAPDATTPLEASATDFAPETDSLASLELLVDAVAATGEVPAGLSDEETDEIYRLTEGLPDFDAVDSSTIIAPPASVTETGGLPEFDSLDPLFADAMLATDETPTSAPAWLRTMQEDDEERQDWLRFIDAKSNYEMGDLLTSSARPGEGTAVTNKTEDVGNSGLTQEQEGEIEDYQDVIAASNFTLEDLAELNIADEAVAEQLRVFLERQEWLDSFDQAEFSKTIHDLAENPPTLDDSLPEAPLESAVNVPVAPEPTVTPTPAPKLPWYRRLFGGGQATQPTTTNTPTIKTIQGGAPEQPTAQYSPNDPRARILNNLNQI